MTAGWRGNIWGLFLVVLGGWWLLGELAIVPFDWGLVGPLAIVMVGLSMLFGVSCYRDADA